MRFLLIAALLILATSAASAQSPTRCVTPGDACAAFDAFLTAFNQRAWDAFRATLADDMTAILDTPVLPERRDGRVAVEEAFIRFFPPPGGYPTQPPPPIKPDNLLVQDLGEVVIVSFHLRAPDEVARRTVVLRRMMAGWCVVHIHGSSFALSSH
jgi:hypothetical protein